MVTVLLSCIIYSASRSTPGTTHVQLIATVRLIRVSDRQIPRDEWIKRHRELIEMRPISRGTLLTRRALFKDKGLQMLHHRRGALPSTPSESFLEIDHLVFHHPPPLLTRRRVTRARSRKDGRRW